MPISPGLFFDRQANARRRTWLFMLYFPLLFLFIIITVNVTYFFYTVFSMQWVMLESASTPYSPERVLAVNLGGLLFVLGGVWRKWRSLRHGGHVVAESLGARRIDGSSEDFKEKRFVNVVEEMAIAARLPVPGIYVLDNNWGINAFAAGLTPQDAVIAVTSGALEMLNRDELQAVVAHETGHILNGDSRLNMRMIAWIYGLQLLALIGGRLADPNYRRVGAQVFDGRKAAFGPSPILGYILWFLGYVGMIFGRIVQAAVSRQREHLADASATQFTRNPESLARALMKIGGQGAGSTVARAGAEEANHLFFNNNRSRPPAMNWLATHPPLVERIKLLYPVFDGQFPKRFGDEWVGLPGVAAVEKPKERPKGAAALVGVMALVQAQALLESIPEGLKEAAHQGDGAQSLIYALLLDPEAHKVKAQLTWLGKNQGRGRMRETIRFARQLRTCGPEGRLALADLAPQALVGMSAAAGERFRESVAALIAVDGRMSLPQYVINRLIERNLDPQSHREPLPSTRIHSFKKVAQEVAVLFSAMARLGRSGAAAEEAFGAAMGRLGRRDLPGLLPAEGCKLRLVDGALEKLAYLSDEFKNTLLDALALLVIPGQGDHLLLMRAVTVTLNRPMPPMGLVHE